MHPEQSRLWAQDLQKALITTIIFQFLKKGKYPEYFTKEIFAYVMLNYVVVCGLIK